MLVDFVDLLISKRECLNDEKNAKNAKNASIYVRLSKTFVHSVDLSTFESSS